MGSGRQGPHDHPRSVRNVRRPGDDARRHSDVLLSAVRKHGQQRGLESHRSMGPYANCANANLGQRRSNGGQESSRQWTQFFGHCLTRSGSISNEYGKQSALRRDIGSPGQGLSVNRQRNFSNSFIVDGLAANDDAAGLSGSFMALMWSTNFRSSRQAEFRRALGGYMNVVTKSGTNTVHGDVYDSHYDACMFRSEAGALGTISCVVYGFKGAR
jgi:hypothetical protein